MSGPGQMVSFDHLREVNETEMRADPNLTWDAGAYGQRQIPGAVLIRTPARPSSCADVLDQQSHNTCKEPCNEQRADQDSVHHFAATFQIGTLADSIWNPGGKYGQAPHERGH